MKFEAWTPLWWLSQVARLVISLPIVFFVVALFIPFGTAFILLTGLVAASLLPGFIVNEFILRDHVDLLSSNPYFNCYCKGVRYVFLTIQGTLLVAFLICVLVAPFVVSIGIHTYLLDDTFHTWNITLLIFNATGTTLWVVIFVNYIKEKKEHSILELLGLNRVFGQQIGTKSGTIRDEVATPTLSAMAWTLSVSADPDETADGEEGEVVTCEEKLITNLFLLFCIDYRRPKHVSVLSDFWVAYNFALLPAVVGGYLTYYILNDNHVIKCGRAYDPSLFLMCPQDFTGAYGADLCCEVIPAHIDVIPFMAGCAAALLAAYGAVRYTAIFILAGTSHKSFIQGDITEVRTYQKDSNSELKHKMKRLQTHLSRVTKFLHKHHGLEIECQWSGKIDNESEKSSESVGANPVSIVVSDWKHSDGGQDNFPSPQQTFDEACGHLVECLLLLTEEELDEVCAGDPAMKFLRRQKTLGELTRRRVHEYFTLPENRQDFTRLSECIQKIRNRELISESSVRREAGKSYESHSPIDPLEVDSRMEDMWEGYRPNHFEWRSASTPVE